jgi:hypothetical protein
MKKQVTPMEPGFRRVGAASCRIAVPTSMPANVQRRTREIVKLETAANKRGEGYATTLMHRVCAEADQMGFLLILRADPFPNEGEEYLSQSNLEGWYASRFGFQMIQEDIKLMARMPGSTPRTGLKLLPVVQAVVETARHG